MAHLSILIPAHNATETVAQTLESLAPQLGGDCEVVAIDDGSSDGTGDLLHATLGALRVTTGAQTQVLQHAQPLGVAATRNRLLQAARGNWIWFIDADDRVRPDAVGHIRRGIERDPALDLILLDHAILRERPGWRHRLRGEHHRHSATGAGGPIHSAEELLRRTLPRAQWHPWGRVVRRSAWPPELRFPEGRVFEDLAIVPRLMAGLQRAVYLDRPLVDYRSRPGSILGSITERKLDDWREALVDLALHAPTELLAPSPDLQRAWGDHLAAQAVRLVRVAQRRGLDPATVKHWQQSLQDLPGMPDLRHGATRWLAQPARWGLALQARRQAWPAPSDGDAPRSPAR